jgi:hypothetical protein
MALYDRVTVAEPSHTQSRNGRNLVSELARRSCCAIRFYRYEDLYIVSLENSIQPPLPDWASTTNGIPILDGVNSSPVVCAYLAAY